MLPTQHRTARWRLTLALSLVLMMCAGCFGGDADDDASDGSADSADSSGDAALDTASGDDSGEEVDGGGRGAYPAGPYGVGEGATIANLSFVNIDGSPTSLEAIYDDPDNTLILLSTAAGWCTACIEEQPKLQALSDAHPGLHVMVVYFQDAEFNPARPEDAALWKDRYDLTLQVVADEPFVMSDYYDESLTPLNMIIDVASMEIVWQTTGWDQTTIEAIINDRL